MNELTSWLQGRKTYIVSGIAVALGVMQAFGVPVAPVVWPVLGALGLTTLRAGVTKADNKAEQAVADVGRIIGPFGQIARTVADAKDLADQIAKAADTFKREQ